NTSQTSFSILPNFFFSFFKIKTAVIFFATLSF
ncbi:MAG: hypothetical protein ACI85O_003607, partial [Saprospiraceae bacterium]